MNSREEENKKAEEVGRDAGAPSDVHKGWYSRHYLPHFDEPGLQQFITFRLFDAVPLAVLEEWKEELSWSEALSPTDPRVMELHNCIARYEDAHHGACWLRQPAIAEMVEDTLLHFDAQRYCLLAWCVMPNHVHVLIEMRDGWPLEGILHTWKSYSAQEANKMLRRKGPFWFREYFDRFMRNEEHFHNTVAYIVGNPVRAGLVAYAEAWRYSSAYLLGAPASLPTEEPQKD
jgi:REP element-mobilizing transposase RayT